MFVSLATSKIRAQKIDESAFRCSCRILKSVKISLWIPNPGKNIFKICRSVHLFTPLFTGSKSQLNLHSGDTCYAARCNNFLTRNVTTFWAKWNNIFNAKGNKQDVTAMKWLRDLDKEKNKNISNKLGKCSSIIVTKSWNRHVRYKSHGLGKVVWPIIKS